MENAPRNLSQWVKHLSNEEMPIMANTARTISEVANSLETSVAELSHIILQDSSMTARVLRVANSVHYNYGSFNNTINTVSRAVVVLGFDAIRSVSLTIAMVDTLLQGEQHDKVLMEMARSFHAAVQARAIALETHDELPEEVFIAALLSRMGQMVFWCFPYGMTNALIEELKLSPNDESEAEKRVLGFPLNNLTTALNREWHLSGLLEQSKKGNKKIPRVAYLDMAVKLARAVEQGWNNKEVSLLLDKIGKVIGKTPEETFEFVSNNAQLARDTAIEFGATAAGRLIPMPPMVKDDITSIIERKNIELAPDPHLQLHILRELSTMLTDKVDLNAVFSTVLEGIFRGLSMDRAWFAVIASGRSLTIRYSLGSDIDDLGKSISVDPDNYNSNVFIDTIKSGKAHWVKDGKKECNNLSSQTKAKLGNEFFLMPVTLTGISSGLFYCDRHISKSPMDEESFQGFRHFCEHVSIALSLMKK